MKWLEDLVRDSFESESEFPGFRYQNIAEIADSISDSKEMIWFIEDFFISQKWFAEFIGVGESTVAGWVKTKSFPDYAKRAVTGAYYVRRYYEELREAKRDMRRPKVVKDGDRFLIVQFETDEAGVSIGKVVARDIPSERTALIFARGIRAWELLDESEEVIDQEIERRDDDSNQRLKDLKDEIATEKLRTFAHEKLVELEKKSREDEKEFREEMRAIVEGAEELSLVLPTPDVASRPYS